MRSLYQQKNINSLSQSSITQLQNEIDDLNNDIATLQSQITVLQNATRIIHEPIVTSSVSSSSPGKIPDLYLVGTTTLGLMFAPTDEVYKIFRTQSTYVGNASLHIHWTKSDNINEAGKVVKWRVEFSVFECIDGDISVIHEVSDISTYTSSELNSRIIYRTANMDISSFITSSQYVSIKVDYIPNETTLVSAPVLISVDLITQNKINE